MGVAPLVKAHFMAKRSRIPQRESGSTSNRAKAFDGVLHLVFGIWHALPCTNTAMDVGG
jgi:hypothetical protein